MTRETYINIFYFILQIFSYLSYFLQKWGKVGI